MHIDVDTCGRHILIRECKRGFSYKMMRKRESVRDSGETGATKGAGMGRPILAGALVLLAGIALTLVLGPLGGAPVAQEEIVQEEVGDEVTFYRDIVPILQEHCQECHRPNFIGPLPLITYDDVSNVAPLIQEALELRTMPPWGAAVGYGEFKNERVMTRREINTIYRWVEAGTPEGDVSDQPPPRQFPEGWQLGIPDLELDPGGDFKVRAKGRDFFRSFVLPFSPEEDVYITAIEVIPGAKEVVHHLGIYLDEKGISPELDRKSPGLGFAGDMGFRYDMILDLWAPGGTPRTLGPGLGWHMPAGSYLVMDIHYAPDGETRFDRTRVGIHFAKGPVNKRVYLGVAGNSSFTIPAGARRYWVTAQKHIRQNIHLLAGWPHMHLLGQEMRAWATLPNGSTQPLVWVPNYDFFWQEVYEYKEPLALPKGTVINMVAYYDNSTENPLNPYEKPRDISFGQRANDEMAYYYYYYTVDNE
jgi:hypothetical protein